MKTVHDFPTHHMVRSFFRVLGIPYNFQIVDEINGQTSLNMMHVVFEKYNPKTFGYAPFTNIGTPTKISLDVDNDCNEPYYWYKIEINNTMIYVLYDEYLIAENFNFLGE